MFAFPEICMYVTDCLLGNCENEYLQQHNTCVRIRHRYTQARRGLLVINDVTTMADQVVSEVEKVRPVTTCPTHVLLEMRLCLCAIAGTVSAV